MQPLAGLTVVALEQAVAAPYCTSRLADAGARVIKIERAEGDFARGYDRAVNGTSSYFAWLNRGKQSLVADIKHADDLAMIRRMLASADVFVQNLAPGAVARAGLDPAALREANPRLITVDISGYGAGNVLSGRKAYDLLVQAETGLAALTGHPAGPGRTGVSVCDIACGMSAHAAVLEALIQRGITGHGTHIEVSLFDSVADWMTVPLLYFEGTGITPARSGLAHPSIAPYGVFESADGHAILIAIQNEREWASFCDTVLGNPGLATSPAFASNSARVANRADLDRSIGATFAALNREEAIERLAQAGTAFGTVNTLPDLQRHPALRRDTVTAGSGEAALIQSAALFDGASRPMGPVPDLDQHGAAVRAEFGAAS